MQSRALEKTFASWPLRLLLMLVALPAAAQQADVEPTAFESFLARTAVEIAEVRELGAQRGRDSTIGIYWIEAQDLASPGVSGRGVRIDLESNAWNASVWLSAEEFVELARDVTSMASYGQDVQDDPQPEFQFGWRGRGTAACWMPDPPQRVLCPSYVVNEGFASFSISVFGSEQAFTFGTDELAAMSEIFSSARRVVEAGGETGSAEPIVAAAIASETPAQQSSAIEVSSGVPVTATVSAGSAAVPADSTLAAANAQIATEAVVTGNFDWGAIVLWLAVSGGLVAVAVGVRLFNGNS